MNVRGQPGVFYRAFFSSFFLHKQRGVWDAKEYLGEGLANGGKEGATEMRECSAVQLSGTRETRAREFTQNTAGLWTKLYPDL